VPNRSGTGGGTSGSSRLLLTRLHRDGTVWDVYIGTTSQAGARNVTRLEFEASGAGKEKVRYTRPAEGRLLEALHSGTAVSRAELEQELERAILGGATTDDSASGR
jgi:hypothetical protein